MNNIHKLNSLELPILLGCVGDLQRYGAMQPRWHNNDLKQIREREKIYEAQDGLVHLDAGRWLGMATDDPAIRMGISRAYLGLQRRGLVERHALGFTDKRTTHLKPTEAGIALAKQLTTPATSANTLAKETA